MDSLDRAVEALGCSPAALALLIDGVILALDKELGGREPTDEEWDLVGGYLAMIIVRAPYIRLVMAGDGADLPLGLVCRRVVHAGPEIDRLVATWGTLFKVEDWAREMRATVRAEVA